MLIGGLVGAEREFRDKAAGFGTIILIPVGSTLFTIFSMSMDPGFTRTRIPANIVTGIGSPAHHEKFSSMMLKDEEIDDFVY